MPAEPLTYLMNVKFTDTDSNLFYKYNVQTPLEPRAIASGSESCTFSSLSVNSPSVISLDFTTLNHDTTGLAIQLPEFEADLGYTDSADNYAIPCYCNSGSPSCYRHKATNPFNFPTITFRLSSAVTTGNDLHCKVVILKTASTAATTSADVIIADIDPKKSYFFLSYYFRLRAESPTTTLVTSYKYNAGTQTFANSAAGALTLAATPSGAAIKVIFLSFTHCKKKGWTAI